VAVEQAQSLGPVRGVVGGTQLDRDAPRA
jgi:hypothetical protein